MMLCELPPPLVIDIDLSDAVPIKVRHLVLSCQLDPRLVSLRGSAESEGVHDEHSGCFKIGS